MKLRILSTLLSLTLIPQAVEAVADAPAIPVPAISARYAALAKASPLARAARQHIEREITGITDPTLREETRRALLLPQACVRHRQGLDRAGEQRIVAQLVASGLLAPDLDPATVHANLFPPLSAAPCPLTLTQVLAAPGGNSGSHHAWPGGLAVHIATNLDVADALIAAYAANGAAIDADRTRAAVLWHDWAKVLVLGWGEDGTTLPELQVAGTGAHHILGLAEAMARGLPATQIAVQACAHGAPQEVGRDRVAKWLQAAAIVARRNPVDYPVSDGPECLINNMADQNWILGDAAIETAHAALEKLGPAFGFVPADRTRFIVGFEEPILAWLGADAFFGRTAEAMQPKVKAALSASDGM